MPLAEFPTLSVKRLRDIQGEIDENRIEFQSQVLSKMRRQSSAETESQSIPYHLPQSDLDTLMTFWRDTLKQGVKMFTMLDPYSEATEGRYRFLTAPQKGRVLGRRNGERVYEVRLNVRKMP